MYNCTTLQLYNAKTLQLYNSTTNFTTVQLYKKLYNCATNYITGQVATRNRVLVTLNWVCTTVQLYNCTTVQLYN